MAGSNLSFVIALKFLTENFNKGTTKVKASLYSLQRQFISLTAAIGAGSIGLSGFASKLINTAKETSRVGVALKNVSKTEAEYVESQRWLLDLSKKYGVEINSLTSGYTKFKAAADISNMSLADQRKIFESVSRAAVAFGLSTEAQRGVFMALAQMMSKGKVQAEELRLQMAERMPVAIQAMAKAVGGNVSQLEAMMEQGKVLSNDVLPKFADALNELIPKADTDKLDRYITDIQNIFTNLVRDANVEGVFKRVLQVVASTLEVIAKNVNLVIQAVKVGLWGALGKGMQSIWGGFVSSYDKAVAFAEQKVKGGQRAAKRAAQAEMAYNTAIADHAKAMEAQRAMSANASAEERIAIEARVAQTTKKLKEAETTHFKAQEKLKSNALKVSEQERAMAQQATATGWAKVINVVKFSASRALVALRNLFFSNIWTAALAVVGSLGAKLYNIVRDTYRLKNAAKEIANVEATPEMKELDMNLSLIRSKDDAVRAGAIEKINQILGTQLSKEEDINKAVETRLKLLNAEMSLREAEKLRDTAVKQRALKERDGIGSDSYQAAHAMVLERQGDVDYWSREIARLAGIEKTYKSKTSNLFPLGGGGGSKGKVEIPVVLKAEKIEFEPIEMPEFTDPEIDIAPIDYRDKSRDWKLSNTEVLEADLNQAKQYLDELRAYAAKTGEDLYFEITEQMMNVDTLEEAFRLAELADAAKEVQKELADTKLGLFTDSVNNIEGVVSAFARLNEVMEENGDSWERVAAILGVFKSITDGVISTIETIMTLKELQAKQERIDAQKNTAAKQGEAVANATTEASKMPFPYNIVAIATAVSAVLAAFASIPKFANGGVVGGNSPTGDKILARLNSGEGVLTRTGMGTLYNMMQGGAGLQVSGEFKVKGRDLVAAIKQNEKFQNRTK